MSKGCGGKYLSEVPGSPLSHVLGVVKLTLHPPSQYKGLSRLLSGKIAPLPLLISEYIFPSGGQWSLQTSHFALNYNSSFKGYKGFRRALILCVRHFMQLALTSFCSCKRSHLNSASFHISSPAKVAVCLPPLPTRLATTRAILLLQPNLFPTTHSPWALRCFLRTTEMI